MMYKTIYRFRVRVEGKSLTFPLHLCIYQNKAPQFEELLDKMRHTASHHGISMNDYFISLENNRHHGVLLHDDQSLQVALKQMSERHYLELTLQRKRAYTLSPPVHLSRHGSVSVHPTSPTPSFSDIPVIKPTVLRLSPGHYAESRRSSSISIYSTMMMDIDTEASSCSIRKDSGISLDDYESESDEKGPEVKEQRAVSEDHQLMTRKLPELHSPPHTQHRPSLFESPSHIVHPLEFRRPSTTPPSPPPGFRHPNTPIKLPAIISFTSNNSHTQLAPIHRHLSYDAISSPPQTPFSTANTSPSTSSESPTVAVAVAAAAAAAPPRRPSSTPKASLHKHQPPSSPGATASTTAGQFLCEHTADATSGRICGQTFRRSYDLSRHQSIHMKDRPFCFCSQCGKKFTRMDALRRHERVQGHATKRFSHRRPSATPSVHLQQTRV